MDSQSSRTLRSIAIANDVTNRGEYDFLFLDFWGASSFFHESFILHDLLLIGLSVSDSCRVFVLLFIRFDFPIGDFIVSRRNLGFKYHLFDTLFLAWHRHFRSHLLNGSLLQLWFRTLNREITFSIVTSTELLKLTHETFEFFFLFNDLLHHYSYLVRYFVGFNVIHEDFVEEPEYAH